MGSKLAKKNADQDENHLSLCLDSNAIPCLSTGTECTALAGRIRKFSKIHVPYPQHRATSRIVCKCLSISIVPSLEKCKTFLTIRSVGFGQKVLHWCRRSTGAVQNSCNTALALHLPSQKEQLSAVYLLPCIMPI